VTAGSPAVRLPSALTRPFTRAVRDEAAGQQLELLLVSSIAAILGIRGYLELTGYPQLGGGGLHIAHMLWGGLLMLVGLVLVLSLINRGARRLGAIIGGLGFGTFIDELGKFITSDNNYFFQPTIGIIYVILIVLFLAFRWLGRGRTLTPEERLVNAAAMLPELIIGGASPREVRLSLDLLDRSTRRGPLWDAVHSALLGVAAEAAAAPEPETGLGRMAAWGRKRYEDVLATAWFRRALVAVMVITAVFDVLLLLFIVLLIAGAMTSPEIQLDLQLNWTEAATLVSSAVAAALTVAGAVRLRRSLREALILYRRGILISIFFTEVFLFLDSQLAALWYLAFNFVLLLAVDSVLGHIPIEEAPAPAPVLAGAVT
jgi:hypothetical protein